MENKQLSFLAKYTQIDKFQSDAFDLIENYSSSPSNIIITAHTGSGKSLIAEYGIYYTIINKDKKVIYTSPIKSLSNQKFHDFNKKFKEYNISIGILTGDIKFQPDSDCIIVTTEILLNMLIKYKSGQLSPGDIDFNNIGLIVFDEFHYINDIDRGNVWEQSIMYIPKNIQIIALSATLNQPAKIGKWIESIHEKPSHIISTTRRVVPLYFNLYYAFSQGLLNKLPKEKKNIISFNKLVQISDTVNNRFDELAYTKIIKFDSDFKKTTNYKWFAKSIINEMLKKFYHDLSNGEELNMFPIQFFILNKKKCLELANNINIVFITGEEQVKIDRFINKMIRDHKLEYLEKLPQFMSIKKLANRGIAIHHSGLHPIFKEIIEILYQDGLIKVLFATETFSVGLNMPTKTVVFTELTKFTNGGFRHFESHEFIQMAGRAGRRNIDTKGYVILLPQLFRNSIPSVNISNMIHGSPQHIESKLHINEILVLRMLKNNSTLNTLIDNIKMSLLSNNLDLQLIRQSEIVTKIKSEYDLLTSDNHEMINLYNYLTQPMIKLSKSQNIELQILKSNQSLVKNLELYSLYKKETGILDNMSRYLETNIQNMLDLLDENDMITYEDDNIILTNKGILGSFIINADPIIIVKIILSPFFNTLDNYNIITLLSTLTFSDNLKDPLTLDYYKDNRNFIWVNYIESFVETYYDKFNFDYVWLLDEFIRTGVYSSSEEDEDYLGEGNFIRSCSKLLNLISELRNMAEHTLNYDLMRKMDECNIILQKDWLKPMSIYLSL